MQATISFGCIVVLVFCGIESDAEVATFAPFMRSRYSLRRRQTTTSELNSDANQTTENVSNVSKEALNTNASTSNLQFDSTANSTTASSIKNIENTSETMATTTLKQYFEAASTSTAHPNADITKEVSKTRDTSILDIVFISSTTVHPKEKHIHNLAEYDYYDTNETEESYGKHLEVKYFQSNN